MNKKKGLLERKLKFVFLVVVVLSVIIILYFQEGLISRDENKPYNVILIVIDALKYDHLNCYGYERNTSPNIESLADDGVTFSNAFSQAPWTKPSTASLFTSYYPSQHGVFRGIIQKSVGKKKIIKGDVLSESLTTLAEVLNNKGYITAAFIHNPHLSPAMGFSQGFEYYNENSGYAPTLTASAINWIKSHERGGKNFFLYLHYIEPHGPYCPPLYDRILDTSQSKVNFLDYKYVKKNWTNIKSLINSGDVKLKNNDVKLITKLYDGEIYYTDWHLGLLVEWLKENNLYNDSMIILTADHGELLYEHKLIGHPNRLLYDELLHIPLIIKFPNQERKSRSIDSLVQSIDIMPTILDYTGIQLQQRQMGSSMIPLIRRSFFRIFKKDKKLIFSESEGENISLRSSKYKYIEYKSQKIKNEVFRFLFELKKQTEENNILDSRPKLVEKFQNKLQNWRNLIKISQINAKEKAIKNEDIERLRSLGYLK